MTPHSETHSPKPEEVHKAKWGCLQQACSALPWLKRPSDLGMWWAFWEGKYSLWQVIKIPAGWMAMNEEIGNSMVGWINSANQENCQLEGSIWFPALGGWPNASTVPTEGGENKL